MTSTEIALNLASVPFGFALSNVSEWLLHKHMLHGLGRRRASFWSFHWHEHHRASRKRGMLDPDYERSPFSWNAQGKEVLALSLTIVPAAAIAPWVPLLSLTMLWCAFDYYRKHKRAHLDPAWARRHLPWHVDHHLGPDQDANWCVTHPWCDVLLGTRQRWVGTPLEKPLALDPREGPAGPGGTTREGPAGPAATAREVGSAAAAHEESGETAPAG